MHARALKFRTKKDGSKDVYPLDDSGSSVVKGHMPSGRPALKKNANEAVVTNKERPTKTEKEESESPPTSSSSDMCSEAEAVLKENDE